MARRSTPWALNAQSKPSRVRQLAEAGITNPPFDGALSPGLGGPGQQAMQELQMTQRFLLGHRQRRIQRVGWQWESQGSERGFDVVM